MERNKAIEVIKKNWPDSSFTMLREALKTLIPELKDREDERTRKDIVFYIAANHKDDGEKARWLYWLEKQGKQKPADKVEPKFRIETGKWYICISQYCNCIEGRCYQASSDSRIIDDFGTEYDMHSDADKYFRLWTIQDAKDGDVLCTYECGKPKFVFILKGTPKKHYALSYHCYYNIMYPHFGSDSEKGCLAPNDEDVKPATKEQRNTLFAKIKEDGYEWDTDKKELKKDEQKPEWSEEDERKMNWIIAILQNSTMRDANLRDANEGAENWLKSLRPQPQWKPSEEEMKALKEAVDEHFDIDGGALWHLYEDLKKLKA